MYSDCNECMRTRDIQARQLLGCGYEPQPADDKLRMYVQPWDGTSMGRQRSPDELDAKGRVRLPVCPGYVCALPEVIETSWAHAYWEKGELTQWCEGQSTEQLRDAVNLLALETSLADAWSSENPVKR